MGIKIVKACEQCTYKCWVNGTNFSTSLDIQRTKQRKVDRLKPNTKYTIGCVEVYTNGWYGCSEFNRTVVIGEFTVSQRQMQSACLKSD